MNLVGSLFHQLNTLEDWYHLFQIVGACAIVATLLAIKNQIKVMRLHARSTFDQTAAHKEQANIERASQLSKGYDIIREAQDEVFDLLENSSPTNIVAEVRANPKVRQLIYGVLDYYEEVGTHYNLGNADRATIQRILRTPIVRMWDKSYSIIVDLRVARNHSAMYVEFEALAKAMKDVKPS